MNKLHDDQSGFGAVEVILILVIVVLVGVVGYMVYKNQTKTATTSTTTKLNTAVTSPDTNALPSKTNTPTTLLKGDFGDSGEYGTFQAEGYPTAQKVDESFCQSNCKQYSYVFFNIARTENTHIFDYLKSNEDNSFVKSKAIGMGCLKNEQITYSNASDTTGKADYSVSRDDTAKIMAASVDKPIVLELGRLKLSGGGGAPACYSHFTTFRVVGN